MSALQTQSKITKFIQLCMKYTEKCVYFLNSRRYYEAIESGKKAIALYPGSLFAHVCLGMSYYNIGMFDLALEEFKIAEDLSFYSNNPEFYLGVIYNSIGMVYFQERDLDKAIFYYNKALNLTEKQNDLQLKTLILGNIALVHAERKDFKKALDYYEKALKLAKTEEERANVYSGMALVYKNKKDYEKALDYFKKAIETAKSCGNHHLLAKNIISLGEFYREIKDYALSEKYLFEGLRKIQNIGDKFWEASAYEYIGLLYIDQGDKALGKDYLIKAFNLFKSLGIEKDAQEISDFLHKNFK